MLTANNILRISGRVALLWMGGLLLAMTAACRDKEAGLAGSVRPLAVIVSCDTAGWIVPCGCSSKQAGGLLRRATYVQGIRRSADVLLADAGGAPGGTSPYDRQKFAAVLRGEIEMQTAAHNIGAAEAEFGVESLRELVTELHAPLISTNVKDGQGHEFVPTHGLIKLGGQRIAIAGLLSTKYAREGLKIDDPYESLIRLMGTLKGQFDQLLVLAYLPEDELEILVNRVPEADMFVGGPTRQTIAPRRAGPSIWGATTNRGKFLVHLERATSAVPWQGKIVELDHEIADDAIQAKNLKRFRDELTRLDFRADQTGFNPMLSKDLPTDYRIDGTETCQKCHPHDCQHWSETSHGHAWKTLTDKNAQMDPYCQHCHTTGYGLPGGFASMSTGQQRQNVGCESCHGPSHAHVLRPTKKTLYDARDRCTQCHDHENSPKFRYEEFWSQIVHGVSASPADGE